MPTREGKAQISINVPEDLYREYKEVLQSRIPKENTTREIVQHMVDVVDAYRSKHGEKPFSED